MVIVTVAFGAAVPESVLPAVTVLFAGKVTVGLVTAPAGLADGDGEAVVPPLAGAVDGDGLDDGRGEAAPPVAGEAEGDGETMGEADGLGLGDADGDGDAPVGAALGDGEGLGDGEASAGAKTITPPEDLSVNKLTPPSSNPAIFVSDANSNE